MMDVFFIHGAGGGSWEWKIWNDVYHLKFQNGNFNFKFIDLVADARGLQFTSFHDYVEQALNAIGCCKEFLLVGASMGGLLALKLCEILQSRVKALILVCTALPKFDSNDKSTNTIMKELKSFDIIPWSSGPLSDTIKSLPDSCNEMHNFAHSKWKDESGLVVHEIKSGISISFNSLPSCPKLMIIPEDDDTISADSQQLLAKQLSADSFRYNGMSHVGPLLSIRAVEVASDALHWLERRL